MAKGDWEGPQPSEPKDRPIPTEGTKRKTWAEEAFIDPFDLPQRERERDGVRSRRTTGPLGKRNRLVLLR